MYGNLESDEDNLGIDNESGEDSDNANPRNFISKIYQNNEFMRLKEDIERDMIE